jgi:hypothetical protein
VIIGGILIAFAVDATWERHQARSELRVALTAARSDIAASQAQLSNYWLRWDKQILVSSITLLALAHDVTIEEVPPPGPERLAWIDPAVDQIALEMREAVVIEGRRVVVADSVLGQVLLAPTFDPSLPGVVALLDGGLLPLAEDQSLVRALAQLPGQLADLADEEQQAREHVQSGLAPALSAGNDLAHVHLFTFWGGLGFSGAEGGSPVEQRHVGMTEIRVSQRLVNELATRVKLAWAVDVTARQVNHAFLRLIELLDEELGRTAS